MKLKYFPVLFFLFPVIAFSQTTYLAQDDKQNVLLERMEIKAGKDSLLNFSKIKPFSRKYVTKAIEKYYAPATLISSAGEIPVGLDPNQYKLDKIAASFSRVDIYNMRSALMNNSEWVENKGYDFKSKKPIFKNFYQTPPNLYEVHVKDFDLVVNPV
ncbi:MAG: hypothetical protein ABUT20_20340, partial [Bacteroidota bacterium]